MPSKKEARPAVESKRANDQQIDQSVSPWTPSAQVALVMPWVLLLVLYAVWVVVIA